MLGRKEDPQVVATEPGKRKRSILFEASNEQSVYWGEPLRIVWLSVGDKLYVRLVEVTRIGAPAYAACVLIAVDQGKPRVEWAAQPGGESDCPDWASPLISVLETPDDPAPR